MSKKLLLFATLFFALGIGFNNCSADFGFSKAPVASTNNHKLEEPCDCGEPHPDDPSPEEPPRQLPPDDKPSQPPRPPKAPCYKPTPNIPKCSLKVMIRVKKLEVRRNHTFERVPILSGEVDLCELSKDYLGVLQRTIDPTFLENDKFVESRFIVDDDSDKNRVEDRYGNLICDLRLPPGSTAGLRFRAAGKSTLPVEIRSIVSFDFDENDALHRLGNGACQLKYPVGHYDLKF